MSPHESDEAVRRLLADARHTDPVPADVAARLDDRLAELVAERDGEADTPSTTAPVVDLAARRRRRLGGYVLAAASVVVVGGLALGQLTPSPRDEAASGGADHALAEDAQPAGPRAEPDAGLSQEKLSASPPPGLARSVPQLSSSDPDRVVRRTLLAAEQAGGARPPSSGAFAGCDLGDPTYELELGLLWDGRQARALWMPTPAPGHLEVRVCGTGETVWSAPLE